MLLDIFSGNAFGMVEMGDAIDRVPYKPQGLGNMGIFTPDNLRGTSVAIEDREGKLGIIKTSPRGAPLEQRTNSKAKIRRYETVRIAKEDVIMASELAFTRQFGTEDTERAVMSEIAKRWGGGQGSNGVGLIDDVDLTLERMRLGAIQGKVLDADDSVIMDWTTEFDGTGSVHTVAFLLNSTDGSFEEQCVQLTRRSIKVAKGVWRPNTRLHALCGPTFYDTLKKCPEVRETFRNARRAYEVQQVAGNSEPFNKFEYGGIVWEEYRGTDDNDDVAIPDAEVKLFPVNAPGMFVEAFSPGEKFSDIGTQGRRLYTDILVDRRDTYAELSVYSYPLHICTRPKLLSKGTIAP